ncbi:MAG TPA: hypothetical protein VHF27_00400 [Acidimicrobiales bacterium]|nr:hypothetical protein [Acidimicrobiales bacterium]
MARAEGEVREGLPLAQLLEGLHPANRAALDRLSLVVLRPDCLAAGAGPAVLAHLEESHGAVPVAMQVRTIPAALVDGLYRLQSKIPRDTLWLHHAVFDSGPSALVLVAGVADDGSSGLSGRLYRTKGPTLALTPAPGSMRERFGRTSSFHAVVHVPEDTSAFVAESTLFFGWTALCAHAAAVTRGATTPIPPASAADLVSLEPGPRRLVFQAVLKVKRRIASSLLIRTGPVPPPVAIELADLTAAADRDMDGAGYLDQRECFLAFAQSERPLLESAIEVFAHAQPGVRGPSGPETAQQLWRRVRDETAPLTLLLCTWLLSGHEPYGQDGGERLFSALAEVDVPLSDGQRTLVAAALRHDLNPAAGSEGEVVYPLKPGPHGS